MGDDPADTGEISGAAPYPRIAYQKNPGDHNFEVGAFGLFSDLFPGRDHSAGTTDRYRDLGVDASSQHTEPADTVTFNARYTNEHQRRQPARYLRREPDNTLNDVREIRPIIRTEALGRAARVYDSRGSRYACSMRIAAPIRPTAPG